MFTNYQAINWLWILAPEIALRLTLPDPAPDVFKTMKAGILLQAAAVVENEDLKKSLHNEAVQHLQGSIKTREL